MFRRWRPVFVTATLVLCAVLICGGHAGAFVLINEAGPGQTDPSLPNRVVTAYWSLADMDVNGDGEVSPGEGVPLFIEGDLEDGDVGFTADQIQALRRAFAVWNTVPDSYAAVREEGITNTTLELDAVGFDGQNFVSMVYAGDPTTPGWEAGMVGVTLLTFAIEDNPGTPEIEMPGRLYDVDMAFDGEQPWSLTGTGYDTIDLEGVVVHELGHFFGLDHSWINNLGGDTIDNDGDGETDEDDELAFIEPNIVPVASILDPSRVDFVGVTATMFPLAFAGSTSESAAAAARTLAPDDIAGICSMYPREGFAETTFRIFGEGFNRGQGGQLGFPIFGGLVTAWADVDNNPFTSRVPYIGTITGASYGDDEDFGGLFTVRGLPRSMLTPQNTLVPSSFVVSMQPIDAVPPLNLEGPAYYAWTGIFASGIFAGFPAVIYRVPSAGGDLYDFNLLNLGTVIRFDPATGFLTPSGTYTEGQSGILRIYGKGYKPACFIATVAHGTALEADIDVFRTFRDEALLSNPVGTALVKTYYRYGPGAADFVSEHEYLKGPLNVVLSVAAFVGSVLRAPAWAVLVLLVGFGAGLRIVPKLIRRSSG